MSDKLETISIHAGQENPDPATGARASRSTRLLRTYFMIPNTLPIYLP